MVLCYHHRCVCVFVFIYRFNVTRVAIVMVYIRNSSWVNVSAPTKRLLGLQNGRRILLSSMGELVCVFPLLVCYLLGACVYLFLCAFLLRVTNSNGDQIRQEFLSGKVVLSELWHDVCSAMQCLLQRVFCVHAAQQR